MTILGVYVPVYVIVVGALVMLLAVVTVYQEMTRWK